MMYGRQHEQPCHPPPPPLLDHHHHPRRRRRRPSSSSSSSRSSSPVVFLLLCQGQGPGRASSRPPRQIPSRSSASLRILSRYARLPPSLPPISLFLFPFESTVPVAYTGGGPEEETCMCPPFFHFILLPYSHNQAIRFGPAAKWNHWIHFVSSLRCHGSHPPWIPSV